MVSTGAGRGGVNVLGGAVVLVGGLLVLLGNMTAGERAAVDGIA